MVTDKSFKVFNWHIDSMLLSLNWVIYSVLSLKLHSNVIYKVCFLLLR